MKVTALAGKRKSQVFIGAIIVLMIVLSLGTALLFHSRSLRDVSRLQVNTDQAYSLAKSGMAIAQRYIDEHSSNPTLAATTYNLGQGTVTVEIAFALATKTGNITSKGRIGTSMRVLTKNFDLSRKEGCGGGWVKAYGDTGGDYINILQQIKDGGYVSGGDINSFGAGDYDCFLLKTDATGNVSWSKAYGGTGFEELRFLQQTKDDGYIVTGYTNSFGAGNYDWLLFKTDATGNLNWAWTYGGTYADKPYTVNQTEDGGYIVLGWTESLGVATGYADMFLIKTNATGNITWAKIYGGANSRDDYMYSVQQTNDGGYIAAGYTDSFGARNNFDFLLVKTDADGNVGATYPGTWAKIYYTSGISDNSPGGVRVQQTNDGGYIMATYIRSQGAGLRDALLLKTNADGNMGPAYPGTWAKAYGGTADERLRFGQQTTEGGYIAAGWTNSFGAGGTDAFLLKTDASGSLSWAKAYGGTENDHALSLQQAGDSYILGGYTSSFGAGGVDGLLIKTDAAGNVGCCSIRQSVSPTVTDVTSTIATKSYPADFNLDINKVYSNDGDDTNDTFIPTTYVYSNDGDDTNDTLIPTPITTDGTLSANPVCPAS